MNDSEYLRYKTSINVQYDAGMDAVKLKRATSLRALNDLRKLVSEINTATNSKPAASGPAPDKAKRGAVLDAVVRAISGGGPDPFTVVDVEGAVGNEIAGLPVKRQSISQALKSLEKKGEILVSIPGKGKRATVYNKAQVRFNVKPEGAAVAPTSTGG